jgi:two-component sensor histidine kinase
VRAGEDVHLDAVRRHKDGRLVDVALSMSPMRDDVGNIVGISSIITDISERKARERHIEFLMREVSHRSKNQLAVVQAIAGQTARHSEDVKDFQTRFAERLGAMARTQDLLVARQWQGGLISDLVGAQLAPYAADEGSSRMEMEGPEVELTPDALHNITLALHELATNAAKYGALSTPDGKVVVSWGLTGTGEARRFHIEWRELNGPPVAPPHSKGFGHVVIEDMVASSLHGEVKLDFAPDGLRWTLDIPTAYVRNAK